MRPAKVIIPAKAGAGRGNLNHYICYPLFVMDFGLQEFSCPEMYKFRKIFPDCKSFSALGCRYPYRRHRPKNAPLLQEFFQKMAKSFKHFSQIYKKLDISTILT